MEEKRFVFGLLMMSNNSEQKIHIWSSCVQILDGRDLLNERTDTENRYLKKASYLITPLYIILRYAMQIQINIRTLPV